MKWRASFLGGRGKRREKLWQKIARKERSTAITTEDGGCERLRRSLTNT
jgi:hypothetical protein